MSKRSFLKLVTGRGEEPDYEEEYKHLLTAEPASADTSKHQANKKIRPNYEPEMAVEPEKTEEGQLTIDVYQTAEEMIIKSTIAGVRNEDLDITITADMVTIQGVRKKDDTVAAEDYYYQELYWGAFSRSVILPQEVDTEGAKAGLKDGILTIRLPKFERGRTKKLRINSA